MKTKIKELRASRGMTQAELAKKVDVRRETIVFLEKGKYNPSLLLAHKIATTFDLAIEEVFLL
jgi:putative transcriptional regulator